MWNPMCCINPRWGTLFLGIQLSIMSIILVIVLLFLMAHADGLGYLARALVVGILIIAIAVMSFFLLIGSIKEDAGKIKISLIIWAVIVVLFLILCVLLLIPKSSKSKSSAEKSSSGDGGGDPSGGGAMPVPPAGDDADRGGESSGTSQALKSVLSFIFSEIFYWTWVVYAYYVELTGG